MKTNTTRETKRQHRGLAFADDLAILSDNNTTAIKQIETLKECATKFGLQISLKINLKFICAKLDTQKLNTKYGVINKVPHVKYLGEILEPTGIEKVARTIRIQKLKKAYGKIANIYNKKCMNINTKIRHYNTVIKPETLYASETLAFNNKGDLENIKKEECKIIRKIIGPKLTDEGYQLLSHTVTETLSNIATDIRKRRLKFYGHIMRMLDQDN